MAENWQHPGRPVDQQTGSFLQRVSHEIAGLLRNHFFGGTLDDSGSDNIVITPANVFQAIADAGASIIVIDPSGVGTVPSPSDTEQEGTSIVKLIGAGFTTEDQGRNTFKVSVVSGGDEMSPFQEDSFEITGSGSANPDVGTGIITISWPRVEHTQHGVSRIRLKAAGFTSTDEGRLLVTIRCLGQEHAQHGVSTLRVTPDGDAATDAGTSLVILQTRGFTASDQGRAVIRIVTSGDEEGTDTPSAVAVFSF